MPLGSTSSEGSAGDNISHFAAIRIRVTGAGKLLMSAFSLDDVIYKVMVPFALQKQNRILPTRIINFRQQRASFELKTTGTNEYFKIHRIILFVKESDATYSGALGE